MQEADAGPVKIGWAGHEVAAGQRLVACQTGNPRVLRLRAVVRGPRELEQGLHRDFAHLRIRGEWFEVDEDMATVIAVAEIHWTGARYPRALKREYGLVMARALRREVEMLETLTQPGEGGAA